ncbi:internal scaffolding protein [Microviridae sp.]|nr:internal scaffolding protein [Microviridae sp.]
MTSTKKKTKDTLVLNEKSSRGRSVPRFTTKVDGETLTKQSFKHETNINSIMAKYQANGEMPVLNPQAPNYGYAPSYDFREAMEKVLNIETQFAQLPAKIRGQFDHDPATFLEFVEDPDNIPEMIDLGLLSPIEGDTPTPAAKSPENEPQTAPTPPNADDGS